MNKFSMVEFEHYMVSIRSSLILCLTTLVEHNPYLCACVRGWVNLKKGCPQRGVVTKACQSQSVHFAQSFNLAQTFVTLIKARC